MRSWPLRSLHLHCAQQPPTRDQRPWAAGKDSRSRGAAERSPQKQRGGAGRRVAGSQGRRAGGRQKEAAARRAIPPEEGEADTLVKQPRDRRDGMQVE